MRVFLETKALAFVFVLGSPSALSLEAAEIAAAFGIDVSPLITEQQRATLSPQFFDQFRSQADLNAPALTQYLSDHPLELEAFRAYLQGLVDRGMIEPDFALSVLEQGIRTFAVRPLYKTP